MISALKKIFSKPELKPNNNNSNQELELLCGLMVEAANIDGKIDNNELSKIKSSLVNLFNEKIDEIENVINDCVKNVDEPNSLYSYTSKINKIFNEEQKMNLLEILWEIILADEKVHDFEDNLIRRLSGLLYVSDVKCGNAKKNALAKIRKT